MSRIFDALSRRRPEGPRAAPAHLTAHGDAVLATLGYQPRRRRLLRPTVLLVLGGLLLAGWALRAALQPAVPVVRPEPPPASAPTGFQPEPAPPVSTTAVPPERSTDGATDIEDGQALPRGRGGPRPAERPAPSAEPAPRHEPRGTAPAPDLMATALYHHQAGNFERALVAYQALLQADELNAAVHNNLGLLYQQKGLEDDAARAFQRALILEPRYALAHNNYGVTLLRQGRGDAAAASFRTVLQLEPRNTDALVNLALAQRASAEPEAAKDTLLRALGMAPHHAMAHYNLAVLYDEAGELARAVEHYQAFLEHAGADSPQRATEVRARLDALGRR